jgi:adenosyl cobinamide kinase/adenosyl cobinamide phosphate guanylyltransferase
MIILVVGGQNSGKSEFAEGLVVKSGADRRYYLATMKVCDDA